ncbi:hypothetical protein [Aurantivibrio infirmus]
MKTASAVLGLLLVSVITGCGGGGGSSDEVFVVPYNPPSLEAFHVVDSLGVSSEDFIDPFLVLNPYIDGGQFEIYWDVLNEYDYSVELRINDVPFIEGSRFVSSDYCGIGLDCDLSGIQFCEYYADFSMSCDPPGTNNPNQTVVRFDDMISTVPQDMYLILDICDTESDYCEYRVQEVSLE